MAVKVKMLRKRFIPVHGVIADAGEIVKVNNEIGMELVMGEDAEFIDPELATRFKPEKPKPESVEKPEVESAMIEPEENAMMDSPKRKKAGRPREK